MTDPLPPHNPTAKCSPPADTLGCKRDRQDANPTLGVLACRRTIPFNPFPLQHTPLSSTIIGYLVAWSQPRPKLY